MIYSSLPKKQGLYDPIFEHDNCGIGFIANVKGKKTHKIIKDALTILKNLDHRGGSINEENGQNSGDGAGILTQIPHKFMQKICKMQGIPLPDANDYAVGMFFCSSIKSIREESIKAFKNIIEDENLEILGIREVSTYENCIGKTAKDTKPYIMQIFIKKPIDIKNQMDFERKLFIISKRAEKEIRYNNVKDSYFYISSLSSKTIVYKGMLTPEQIDNFYIDLLDLDFESSIALVHSRFSTNTFPSWERAHPNRYIVHNGEINTIRGNVNWFKAREKTFSTDYFAKEDLERISPIINEDGSDSARLDNYIQMLALSGYSLPKAIMTAIPEPWENSKHMTEEKKAFYQYNSLLGEAWDGPTAIAFSDGSIVGACLDRNGLRPIRYYITKDDYVIASSEVGVLDISEEDIIKKDRLVPGKMLLIDTIQGKIISDEEVKTSICTEHNYKSWLDENLLNIEDIKETNKDDEKETLSLLLRQKMFGYTKEDIEMTIKELVEKVEDPIGAMGSDIPLAVFSNRNQLLYNYFKQLFAQVTNPPIDALREKIVTSTISYLGKEGNLLKADRENCKRIKLNTPILLDSEIKKIRYMENKDFKVSTISTIYKKAEKSMEQAIDEVFSNIDKAIEEGSSIIILSDRNMTKDSIALPMLLISSGVHQYLIRQGNRTKTSLIIESAEPREVHHFALLIGYGANAINPYLALETIRANFKERENAQEDYIKAVTKGIIKVMSKMGISTLQSYQGAQIFEALGICQNVVDKFFTNTTTRIGGLDLKEIEQETLMRFEDALREEDLKYAGEHKWRNGGEYHMFNPKTVTLLQKAVREGSYETYKEYARLMDSHNDGLCTIRSMLDIRFNEKPINIDEVESVDSIVKRFKTGAMSYGSLSQEAHECLAIAMNRLGGKSNSGEGGEIPSRFIPMENGDSKCSAIKQVASGRFGVSINYLNNANEIQIKVAQGAKPGEGGHLPGKKVYPWIAKARNSTTGVDLISPPPHHDIYSIEDLAQLIHDLKNANKDARISVKLVSEAGVGTIAVGVAKSLADVILISGFDGGTGAAPRTSIRHAGLPWELGLSETHQALILNNLRNKVVLEADGKMLTGRDVLVSCLLGAEEFGFSTAPLIAIGCAMLRVCHMDTCSVGVATQNPKLRERFKGKPEHVENFMRFVAMDLREQMAMLGFRTIDEMVGHVEKLKPKKVDGYKARTVDLSSILYQPKGVLAPNERAFSISQNHNIEKSLDYTTLAPLCENAIKDNEKIDGKFSITNLNRVCGTLLSSKITRAKGEEGLKEDTINLNFEGSAGQSFGAFLINGVTMTISGDCNDYVGKGLSGGKIIVKPSEKSNLKADENVIVGNVCLFGAISGEVYINGLAGERFCVRNSGATAVVEGIGEHGLEYMTGGKVVILGNVGRNFGAGMSGGISYVYDKDNTFADKCNMELILLEELTNEDNQDLKTIIENHYKYTNSEKAKLILENLEEELTHFVKVIPKAYKAVITDIENAKIKGYSEEEAMMIAFENSLK